MKHFIIIKTGYSSGVYGCSAEYFTLVIYDPEHDWKMIPINFQGMYGAEYRVAEYLNKAGLIGHGQAFSSNYGKVPLRNTRGFNEHSMLEELKKLYPTQEKGGEE